MKFSFWVIGKNDASVDALCQLYEKRIQHYIPFSIQSWENKKGSHKLPPDKLKQKEAELILNKLDNKDLLILLDEAGKQFTSRDFADKVENWMQSGKRQVVFLVGGAFGFAPELYQRADAQISLSKGTFSHQIIRIMFLEQLYRAYTIINKEPYHND